MVQASLSRGRRRFRIGVSIPMQGVGTEFTRANKPIDKFKAKKKGTHLNVLLQCKNEGQTSKKDKNERNEKKGIIRRIRIESNLAKKREKRRDTTQR